jgi:hypothetical protein
MRTNGRKISKEARACADRWAIRAPSPIGSAQRYTPAQPYDASEVCPGSGRGHPAQQPQGIFRFRRVEATGGAGLYRGCTRGKAGRRLGPRPECDESHSARVCRPAQRGSRSAAMSASTYPAPTSAPSTVLTLDDFLVEFSIARSTFTAWRRKG